MTLKEVMTELESMGSDQTCNIFRKHGIPDPMFGVKVADLKKIVKKVKTNHELSLELYASENYDAMYLAGLIADEKVISAKELDGWAKASKCSATSEYTVAWLTAETPHAEKLADKWLKSKDEFICAGGWATWSNHVALTANEDLDLEKIKSMLDFVEENIDSVKNRVKYTMNGFVISVGTYVKPLLDEAFATATRLGKVKVDVGDTACKVPLATKYIEKVVGTARLGRKKKKARC